MNIDDLYEGGRATVIRAIKTQVDFLSGAKICEVGVGTIVAVSEVVRSADGQVTSVRIEFNARSEDGTKKIHGITLHQPREFLSPIQKYVAKHLENPGDEPIFTW